MNEVSNIVTEGTEFVDVEYVEKRFTFDAYQVRSQAFQTQDQEFVVQVIHSPDHDFPTLRALAKAVESLWEESRKGRYACGIPVRETPDMRDHDLCIADDGTLVWSPPDQITRYP